ncbi:MAG: type II toxin-antitoxin system VapC family toxin [Deltaproteobacteria bacterium]|nr:type II toxin-antitoxin system VapC family toxin [Deltaproteobacteria bacterium]
MNPPPVPTYFDTSVLVKRYIEEPGSAQARRLLDGAHVCTSAISRVEAASAFRRKYKMGEITEADFKEFLERFRKDRELFEFVAATDEILERAEEMVARSAVRSLDAVHVASAAFLQEAAGIRLPFITADDRQGEAAGAAGLKVIFVRAR